MLGFLYKRIMMKINITIEIDEDEMSELEIALTKSAFSQLKKEIESKDPRQRITIEFEDKNQSSEISTMFSG